VPRRFASTAKAEELLGFRAHISLEDGLRDLVDWWRVELKSHHPAHEPQAVVP